MAATMLEAHILLYPDSPSLNWRPDYKAMCERNMELIRDGKALGPGVYQAAVRRWLEVRK
jgi:hypothetical protein